MPSVGPNYSSTCADDATVGTVSWTNVTNAQGTQDNTYATASINTGETMVDNSIKLVKGGTISGNEKATNTALSTTGAAPPASATWVSYGSSSDLWGLSLLDTDITASTFGMAVSAKKQTTGTATHYIKATNFGFSLPAGSTITGVKAEVCWDYESGVTSFVAGTKISTPTGVVPIEEITDKNSVFAFTRERKTVARRVLSTSNGMARTVTITTLTSTVETTLTHRFLTPSGWRDAKDLRELDYVFMFGMEVDMIVGIAINPKKKPVYNLKVSGSPTYFANDFAVHNGIIASQVTTYVDALRITVSYIPAYISSFMWRRML